MGTEEALPWSKISLGEALIAEVSWSDYSRTFSVPGFFVFGSAHALAPPCRGVRTAGKSERLTDGASTSYERSQKSTTSAGGLSEPL